LVDAATRDDAAVYLLSEDRALVVSVDFFAPIVDDPYSFGSIAAANAFSDLYAMGAKPLLALNLVAWPRNAEVLALLGETLRGGIETAQRAGAFVLGGHSIDDPEPKYGMVALGEVHPNRVTTNSGARSGDFLVLTKPLGTGILSTALKNGLMAEDDMAAAVTAMSTLNAGAAQAVAEIGSAAHAVTDVTGFGLLGHLQNLLEASGQCARLSADAVPTFDRVRELISQNAVPGGTKTNLAAANEVTHWADGVSESDMLLLADAQTSGGLLIAVDPSAVADLVRALNKNETPSAAIIGEVVEQLDALIEVGV
jgi:selenide,water dikinase